MSPEQWERVKDLFADAAEQPAPQRETWLREHCPDDAVVLHEVLRLLQHSPADGAYLDQAPVSPALLRQIADQAAFVALLPGELLASRFLIVRRLGAGGMGEVYEAEDRALGTRVAIKTIRPEIAHDPQILARFRREVNLARQVTHPNVCRVYDFAHATRANGAEIDFLTMEYLDGETLSQFLQPRAALTLAEALPLIRQIAEALSAAHRAGVVHRDLKSSNIFLTRHRDGELRVAVTDFGLARSVLPHDGQSLSHSGWGAGTPSYMAPEQLEGKSTGPASDFYSLGVVMYEMATGRSPHAGSSPVEITVRRLKEPLRPPRSLNPRGHNYRSPVIQLRQIRLFVVTQR